jgi:hypothetical protein
LLDSIGVPIEIEEYLEHGRVARDTFGIRMSTKSWQLSRRTFLRGAGAAIALPMLDAMRPITALAASTAQSKAPVRMAILFFPNGVWPKSWVPEKTGADYELPFSLAPLAKLKDQFLVLSGMDKATSHGGDGHYAKTGNFLTGLRVVKTTGKNISCGSASLDQVIAEKIGHQTPLPSLELGIDPVTTGVDDFVGYTRLYGSYISWRSANSPVPREINPRAAYERLFGAKGSNSANHPEDTRSLLDMAMEDAGNLRRRVGRDDQLKLDEYLESVRSVERRIELAAKHNAVSKTATTLPTAPDPRIPKNVLDHVRLMLDLMVLSFQTDATRVGTFMFANDVSPRNFDGVIEGVHGGHHHLSHHQNDADKIEQYQKINRWHVEQFAYVLEKMKAIKEGDGSLLDNSMVMFGSSLSDGNKHDPSNLPILLAGKAGGTLLPGRHLATPKNTPLCNLYVSMLERMRTPMEHFGDSTGALKGLDSEIGPTTQAS